MRIEHGLAAVRREPEGTVTVGSFDGVHLGHQSILAKVIRAAEEHEGPSTLVTFEPHPRTVLSGEELPLLTTPYEKAHLLESMGLDRLVVLDFTREFAQTPPRDFAVELLWGRVGMRAIIVGENHGFGRGRKGDVALLHHIGNEKGFGVEAIPPVLSRHGKVSSSAVRRALTETGDVGAASAMLGRPYALKGTVIRGAGRGKTIGIPTANLSLPGAAKLLPRCGVYVAQVLVQGIWRGGMMNVGVRPTVDDSDQKHIEVHILDFAGDLYGETLAVRFVQRLRDEVKFASFAALKAQLEQDAANSRIHLRTANPIADSVV